MVHLSPFQFQFELLTAREGFVELRQSSGSLLDVQTTFSGPILTYRQIFNSSEGVSKNILSR
jgi:hypothetical protein